MANAAQIEQLHEYFQAIRRKLKEHAHADKAVRLHAITPSQWGILRILAHQEHATVKEIATRLGISSSAATQLVDGLVKNGHLKKTDNPDDKRSQYLTYSEKTKKQMKALRKGHLKRLTHVFSVLSAAELTQYLRLSAKVAASSRS